MYIKPEDMYEEICSGHNLVIAYKKALKAIKNPDNKARYTMEQAKHLIAIRATLVSERYHPGPYRRMIVHEPKRREIYVPPFVDRVVHHALNNVIEPILNESIHPGCQACIKGRGTHRAVDLCQQYLKEGGYVCQGDIEKFFDSIDQEILFNKLKQKIRNKRTLLLIRKVIKGYHTQGRAGKGLPIGSLCSQLFANFYLYDFDHLVEAWTGNTKYVRYMDDWLIFVTDKEEAHKLEKLMGQYLTDELFLSWTKEKTRITPVRTGVPFLGVFVKQNSRRLKRRVMQRANKQIDQVFILINKHELGEAQIKREAGTWLGRGTVIGGLNHHYIQQIHQELLSNVCG